MAAGIRQLAVLLRSALTVRSKEGFREVYCWQTINCLELWAKVLAAHADKQVSLVSGLALLLGHVRSLMKHGTITFDCPFLCHPIRCAAVPISSSKLYIVSPFLPLLSVFCCSLHLPPYALSPSSYCPLFCRVVSPGLLICITCVLVCRTCARWCTP